MANTKQAQVVYEGRSQRRTGLVARLNELNATDVDWKYTIGEKTNDSRVPVDSVGMLLEDGYEILDAKTAKDLLKFDLRGHQVLMRIPRGQHEAYVREAIEKADPKIKVQESGDPRIRMTEPTEKRELITISE